MGAPHGHWQTRTFVADLTLRGWGAPFVVSGPINREAGETWGEQGLVPALRSGDIVVRDNLSSHRGSRARARIAAAGASMLFLPPCSPDCTPIENAGAKLKALLRQAAERTSDGLWTAIGRALDAFSLAECANSFSACSYDPN
jgi:transposase